MSEDRKPCAGCGAEVWWVRHERTGNPAPLVPVPEGMKAMVFDRDGDTVYRIRKKADQFPESLYQHINHFSDCPKAADFKRRSNVSN